VLNNLGRLIDVEQSWGIALKLHWLVRRHYTRVCEELGLHPAQAHALEHLVPGKPRPMGELAKAWDCERSNVTAIADRLQARGLVTRGSDPTDRRIRTLTLTEEGTALRARLLRRLNEPPPELAAQVRQIINGPSAKSLPRARDPHHENEPRPRR